MSSLSKHGGFSSRSSVIFQNMVQEVTLVTFHHSHSLPRVYWRNTVPHTSSWEYQSHILKQCEMGDTFLTILQKKKSNLPHWFFYSVDKRESSGQRKKLYNPIYFRMITPAALQEIETEKDMCGQKGEDKETIKVEFQESKQKKPSGCATSVSKSDEDSGLPETLYEYK